jgi:hypothetical protein
MTLDSRTRAADAAPLFGSDAVWLTRVRGEYQEMPGLSLTERQAQRLWGLEPTVCRSVLHALVTAGFLRRNSNGSYVRVGTQR